MRINRNNNIFLLFPVILLIGCSSVISKPTEPVEKPSSPTPLPSATPEPTIELIEDHVLQIAFTDNYEISSRYDLYLIDVDGNNLQQLTSELDIKDMDWSLDGKQIALFAQNEDTIEAYIMNVATGNLQFLFDFPLPTYYNGQLKWSPDGRYLAFTSDMDGEVTIGGNKEIYIYELASGELSQLTKNEVSDNYISWSPDSNRIAFKSFREDNADIYVVDIENGNEQRLTTESTIDTTYPSWSPDGKMIAFNIVVPGTYLIYVMDSDGGNLRMIADTAYWAAPPFNISWSPDNEKIAFSANVREGSVLRIVDVQSRELKQLTNEGGMVVFPKWSPDGEWITFEGAIEGIGSQICVIKVDGTGLQCLTERLLFPDHLTWRP